ncbi:hypothetical protein KDL45_18340, partial [bacterium]|nr:hypothetical protein [bacterium]
KRPDAQQGLTLCVGGNRPEKQESREQDPKGKRRFFHGLQSFRAVKTQQSERIRLTVLDESESAAKLAQLPGDANRQEPFKSAGGSRIGGRSAGSGERSRQFGFFW